MEYTLIKEVNDEKFTCNLELSATTQQTVDVTLIVTHNVTSIKYTNGYNNITENNVHDAIEQLSMELIDKITAQLHNARIVNRLDDIAIGMGYGVDEVNN